MTAAVSALNAAASAVAVMAAEVAEDATNAETDKKVVQKVARTVVAKADQRLAMNNAVSNEMMAGLQMAAAASAANAVLTHALASSAVTHALASSAVTNAMSEAKAKSSASRVHRVSPESQEKADVKSAPAVNAASVAASSARL